jgi:hypothetical protein
MKCVILERLSRRNFREREQTRAHVSNRVRVYSVSMGKTPFLTGLLHRYSSSCPSLALLLRESAFLPISWRKELINVCQTGVWMFTYALTPAF